MKDWYAERPDLFVKRPYDHPGCDSYFVQYLLDAGQPIETRLLERLKIAVEAEPEWSELQSLYERARR
jgi:hypothetical protein